MGHIRTWTYKQPDRDQKHLNNQQSILNQASEGICDHLRIVFWLAENISGRFLQFPESLVYTASPISLLNSKPLAFPIF